MRWMAQRVLVCTDCDEVVAQGNRVDVQRVVFETGTHHPPLALSDLHSLEQFITANPLDAHRSFRVEDRLVAVEEPNDVESPSGEPPNRSPSA